MNKITTKMRESCKPLVSGLNIAEERSKLHKRNATKMNKNTNIQRAKEKVREPPAGGSLRMSLCDASGEDASGPQIAGSVVAFVKGVDLHTAGGAGVNELTAAQIDAHVADAAEGIEKHQITGLPLLGGDRCGGVILVAGPVGQGVAELGEHSHGEAGSSRYRSSWSRRRHRAFPDRCRRRR